jgi:hypothetical protein
MESLEVMSTPRIETRRVRRIRREIRRRERHRDWVLKQLGLEEHPGKLLELRALLRDLSDPLNAPRSGFAWQESLLPKPNGPPDCNWCHAVYGASVPIVYQRLFEDELRASPGMPNLSVWKKLGYDKNAKVQKGGRGEIALARLSHADHLERYRESRDGSRPG